MVAHDRHDAPHPRTAMLRTKQWKGGKFYLAYATKNEGLGVQAQSGGLQEASVASQAANLCFRQNNLGHLRIHPHGFAVAFIQDSPDCLNHFLKKGNASSHPDARTGT